MSRTIAEKPTKLSLAAGEVAHIINAYTGSAPVTPPSLAALFAADPTNEAAVVQRYSEQMEAYKLTQSPMGQLTASVAPIIHEMQQLRDAVSLLEMQLAVTLGDDYKLSYQHNGSWQVVTTDQYNAQMAERAELWRKQQEAELAAAVEAEITKRGLVKKSRASTKSASSASDGTTTSERAHKSRTSPGYKIDDLTIPFADAVDFCINDTGLNLAHCIIAITKASANRTRYYALASDGKVGAVIWQNGAWVSATGEQDGELIHEEGKLALSFDSIGDAVRAGVALGGLDYTSGAHWGKDAQGQIWLGSEQATPAVLASLGYANAIKIEKSLFSVGNGLPQADFLRAVHAWSQAS